MVIPNAGAFVLPALLLAGLLYARYATASAWSLSQFTSYVAAVVRRNLPLGSSLSAYAQDLPTRRFGKRKVMLSIADTCDNGGAFADALDKHPRVFPEYYRALVRAAESGGNLARVLERLNATIELDADVSRCAAGYAVYPAILATVVTVALAFMAHRFADILAAVGTDLDAPYWRLARMTSLKISFAGMAQLSLLIALASLAAFGVIAAFSLRRLGVLPHITKGSPKPSRIASWLTWHIPPKSRAERSRALSQFALAAGALMDAGLAPNEAVRSAASASGNRYFDAIARAASYHFSEGKPLSEALRLADERGALPPELVWHVEVGEKSGRLPEALMRLSESASERGRATAKALVSLIFPAGIMLVAASVALTMLAVFGALDSVREALSRF